MRLPVQQRPERSGCRIASGAVGTGGRNDETNVVSIYNPKRPIPFAVRIERNGRVAQTRQGCNSGDEAAIEADVFRLLATERE